MIASFVRGLSTRDVENTLAEALGSDAGQTVSWLRGCGKLPCADGGTSCRGRPLWGVYLFFGR